MRLEIRKARAEEINFIFDGVKEIFTMECGAPSRKMLREQRKFATNAVKNKEVIIAIKENKPVGFLWFSMDDKTPFGIDYGSWGRRYCWISWVYVSEKFRNQGIGSSLYDHIVKICKKRGIDQLMLDVFTINKKSMEYHKKMGFKPILSIYSKKIR